MFFAANAACAVVLCDDKDNVVSSKYISLPPKTTNNMAELRGLEEALKLSSKLFPLPVLYGDSYLIIKSYRGWLKFKNKALKKHINRLLKRYPITPIVWVPREKNIAGFFLENFRGV